MFLKKGKGKLGWTPHFHARDSNTGSQNTTPRPPPTASREMSPGVPMGPARSLTKGAQRAPRLPGHPRSLCRQKAGWVEPVPFLALNFTGNKGGERGEKRGGRRFPGVLKFLPVVRSLTQLEVADTKTERSQMEMVPWRPGLDGSRSQSQAWGQQEGTWLFHRTGLLSKP